jgi:phospholipid/cholesterol/gamma-HCH transport system permease protein
MKRLTDHRSFRMPDVSRVPASLEGVGGLFMMSADAVRFLFRRPFQGREFVEQSWFVARVALIPTLLVAIPFTVLVSFTLNILLASSAQLT